MRRFLSCSHWGLFDVTDYPWCCPLKATDTVDIWYVDAKYDGTE